MNRRARPRGASGSQEGELEIIPPQQVETFEEHAATPFEVSEPSATGYGQRLLRIFLYGISRNKLEKALADLGLRAQVVKHADQADAILTLKAHSRRDPGKFQEAASQRVPVHMVRSNTYHQILGALREIFRLSRVSAEERALQEAQGAAEQVLLTSEPIELTPQSSHLRRLQHQLAGQYELRSESIGVEPKRRVRLSK